MLGHAERMIELRGAMRVAADEQTAATGHLHIGGSDTLVHTWLPNLIKRINQRFPRLTLDIQIDLKSAMLAALASRKLDIAFVTEPVDDAALTSVPVSSDAEAAARAVAAVGGGRAANHHPPQAHADLRRGAGPAGAGGTPRCARLYQLVHIDDGGHDPERDRRGTIPIAAVARELKDRKVRLLDVADAPLPPYDFVAAYPRDSQTHITATVAAIASEVAHHGAGPLRTGDAHARCAPAV
jgi:DNA-binding transcriptional LysR family regulator